MHQRLMPLILVAMFAISGCGGGGSEQGPLPPELGGGGAGGDHGGSELPSPTPFPSSTPLPSASPLPSAIATALMTGNAQRLDAADASTLLEMAKQFAMKAKAEQPKVAQIVPDIVTPISFNDNGRRLTVIDPARAVPLVVTAGGDIVAAAAQIGAGRAISYGVNLDQQIDGQVNHPGFPLMKANLAWLLGVDKNSFPKTIKYAVAGKGWKPNSIPDIMKNAGAEITLLKCDITQEGECWQGADLMLFYQGSADNVQVEKLVRRYLEAGKAVLYMTENYAGFNAAVNRAMAIQSTSSLSWAGGLNLPVRTAKQAEQIADEAQGLSARIALMDQLRDDGMTSWSGKIEVIDKIAAEYKSTESQGLNLFTQPAHFDYYKYLVLWADVYRRSTIYDNTIGYNKGAPIQFLRQMASDTWTHSVRDSAIPANHFGEWLPNGVKSLPVAMSPELIQVTIPNQGSGTTLIGRMAVPGKPVQIEVVDADGVESLGVRIGMIRRYPNPLPDGKPAEGYYGAPRLPGNHSSPLVMNGPVVRTYAMGGLLFLNFSGNPQGDRIVTLKITGAAKYGHWDYTQPMSAADKTDAVAAITAGMAGWQTMKLVGGELQEAPIRVNKGSAAAVDAFVYQIGEWVFGANHKTHGYHNIALTPKQANLCGAFDWDCTSRAKHGAPGVQHFVGWYAQCGFACSGNPSDISAGNGAGWATLHELGHNTVTQMESMYSCGTECNNNIVAGISSMYKFYDSTAKKYTTIWDNNGGNFRHQDLFNYVKAARAGGATGEALRQAMYDNLWGKGSDGAKQAVTVQMAFLYSKLRLNQAQPDVNTTMEFMGLLNKAWRLKNADWANKGKYAMSAYVNKDDISKEDGFYVLSSKIIGQDMRAVFEMYGFKLDSRALSSVAQLALPLADRSLYALEANGGNRLHEGVWIDMEGALGSYPAWNCGGSNPVKCVLNP